MNTLGHRTRTRPRRLRRGVAAVGGLSSAQLSWGAATDNVGVARYNVHRGTTPGFTPSVANRIAQPTGHALHGHRGGRHLLLQGHGRGRGRQRRAGLERGVGDGRRHVRRRLRRDAGRGGCGRQGDACRGRRRPTTSAWCATTSIAARAPASRRRPRTGSRSRRRRATSTPRRRAATSTRSPPRTRPATSARVSNEAAATVTADTTRAQPAGRARRLGRRQHRQPELDRLDRQRRRHPLQRPPRHERRLHAVSAANRIAQPTGTSYADTGLATGTYYYKVTAEDAAGNISAASNEATATVADATPPTAPSGLAAAVAGSTVNLSWTAATDNVGVTRYNLHRGTTSGFTPQRRQPDRAADRAQLRRHRPRRRHLLLQADRRGRRRQHRPRLATPPPPPSPTPPRPAPRQASPRPAAPARPASAGPPRPTTSPSPATTSTARPRPASPPATANRIAQPTGTSYTDTGLAAGTYYYKVTAEDAAGNISPASTEATATVSAAARHRPRRRLRLRRRQRHHHRRPIRHRQQRHPHERHLGRRRPASSATHSPSTAPTPSSPSPTRTASTSRPG